MRSWACSIQTRPATTPHWRRRSGPSTRRCSRGAWTTTSRPFAGLRPMPHWSSAPTTASKATAGGGIPTRCCATPACLARTPVAASTSPSTRALFLYSHGGGIFINSTRFKSGVVADGQRSDVKAAGTRGAAVGARPGVRHAPGARGRGHRARRRGARHRRRVRARPVLRSHARVHGERAIRLKGGRRPCRETGDGRSRAVSDSPAPAWDLLRGGTGGAGRGATWHRPPGRPRPYGCTLTRHSAAGSVGRQGAADRVSPG